MVIKDQGAKIVGRPAGRFTILNLQSSIFFV
jgi:hypothetical protein